MSIDAIEIALSAELEKSSLPVAWPNVDYNPAVPGAVPYIAAAFIHAPPIDRTVALSSPRYEGQLIATLVTHKGGGIPGAAGSAKAIAALFPVRSTFAAGALTVRVTEHPHIEGGFSDGAYWRVPVRIRFRAAVES